MAFIFSIFSGSNGHSDKVSPATSRWPNTIQLWVMGSFRSSIQVSSAVFALTALHAANPRTTRKKIDLRLSHRTISHPRSLFLPSTIVKQPASDSHSLVFACLGSLCFHQPDRQLI